MPAHRKSAGVWKNTKPWIKFAGTWQSYKVWKNILGVWTEVYPNVPTAPTVTVASIYRNDQIEIDASWTDPGGTTQTRFNVRLMFYNKTTGALERTSNYVTLLGTDFSYTFDNGGVGWQSWSDLYNIRAEVTPYSGSTTVGFYAGPPTLSALKPIIQLPAPPAPTSWNVDIQASAYSSTWAYTATNRCTSFQVQTWLSGGAITTYNLAATARSLTSEPWNPNTVGRETVNSRIRAVGPGGVSAWVTTSGIMPGPVTLSDVRFEGGRLKVSMTHNEDGVHVYAQRLESGLQWDLNRYTVENNTAYTWADSINLARDGDFRYRFVFKPETAGGWTGRNQVTGWCIKMPNPVYYKATQTLSIRNNAFYTSADGRHVYQGKDGTGYSNAAVAWYGGAMYADFNAARIGYVAKATALHVAMRRYAVGGAGGGTRLSFWVHNQKSYSGAIPTYGDQEFSKYLVLDESAWAALPLKYWDYWTRVDNFWHGLAAYSTLDTEYMILWRHPAASGSIDGQAFWTIRVTHDG